MSRIHITVVPVIFFVLVPLVASVQAAEPKPAPRDTPQGELRNVVAKVIYPNEVRDLSRQAALEPGPFTVPKGYVVTRFIYHWEDPKTDRKNERLTATTIYSVTERRYVTEAKDNPNIILPAGEYKLVCGGLPEATGVLTYRLIREDLVDKPADQEPVSKGPATDKRERIFEVETWASKPNNINYNPKFKAAYHIRDGSVTAKVDQILDPPNYGNGVSCDPIPVKGSFVGKLVGNVITGKWEVINGPYQMHFSPKAGTDYPAHDRTDVYKQNYEYRLTLNDDGSIQESAEGEGISDTQWGPTAPKAIANKRDVFRWPIPPKEGSVSIQGTWTERK